MEFINYLIIIRILGFIVGLILVYSAFKLFKTLQSKEIALSMLFLHKKRIIYLFGFLVIASILTFTAGLLFVIDVTPLIVESLLGLNALVLLIFTALLQRIMRGG